MLDFLALRHHPDSSIALVVVIYTGTGSAVRAGTQSKARESAPFPCTFRKHLKSLRVNTFSSMSTAVATKRVTWLLLTVTVSSGLLGGAVEGRISAERCG